MKGNNPEMNDNAIAINVIGHGVDLVDCASEIGSGALPDHNLPSLGIALRPLPSQRTHDESLVRLARAFRELPVPVIGRIHKGEFVLDCRCLEHSEEFSAQLSGLIVEQREKVVYVNAMVDASKQPVRLSDLKAVYGDPQQVGDWEQHATALP